MKRFLRLLCFVFAAGAIGGLINSGVLYGLVHGGLLKAIGVTIPAPGGMAVWAWLYPRLIWGGIWGVLFLAPILKKTVLLRGLVLSIAPSAIQLLVIFPFRANKGMLGLELGVLTPVVVLGVNAVWGVAADLFLRAVDER